MRPTANGNQMKVAERDKILHRFEANFKRLNGGEHSGWDEQLLSLDYDRCERALEKMSEELPTNLPSGQPNLRMFMAFYKKSGSLSKGKLPRTHGCDYCGRSGYRILILAGESPGTAKPLIMKSSEWKYRPGYIATCLFPCDCEMGLRIKNGMDISDALHKKVLAHYALADSDECTAKNMVCRVQTRLESLPWKWQEDEAKAEKIKQIETKEIKALPEAEFNPTTAVGYVPAQQRTEQ